MQRRTALKYLFIAGGSTLVLTACGDKKGGTSAGLRNLSISDKEEELMALFADTILPKTDTPGAADLGAHLFAFKMIDDCFNREDQQAFEKGLKSLNDFSRDKKGKTFTESAVPERITLLQEIAKDDNAESDVKTFAALGKQLVMRGYTQSKYFMTEVQPYVLVPGHFSGCVDVKAKRPA